MSRTNLTMTSPAARLRLTIGLLLIFLPGLTCQKLSFEKGVERDESSVNWTATGRLKLTRQDTVIFKPFVTVQAVTEVCSISLMSCVANGQAPPTSKSCFCTEVSDEEVNIHISGHGDLPKDQLTVQASVPAQHIFQPLTLTAKIGNVPSLQGGTPGYRPDRVAELEHSLADMAAQLKKADTTIGQLVAQVTGLTTQLMKAEETIGQLVVNNNLLAVNNNELAANITQLSTKNNDLMTNLSQKYDHTGKQITSIASMVTELTNTSKDIDDIHNVVIPTTCTDVNSPYPRPIVTLPAGPIVVCDTTADNGGWVVFQRRTSGRVDFYRDWQQYKDGFGDKPDNFWLGLEAIHQLTSGANYELRVDMNYKGKNYYATYDVFRVLGEDQNYKLQVSGYHGDAGDSLTYHNGHYFSTRDRDHDDWSDGSCAQSSLGAWWYSRCHESNLNGLWASTSIGKRLNWEGTTGTTNSLSFSEMKFRPRRRP